MYGGGCPHLQPIAVKLLSLSATASGCEQNWSSFQYIHSDTRNRLTSRHATDLVWLYCNLRLLKRTQALEQGMPARPWIAPTPEEEDEEQEQQQRKHPPGDVFFPYFSRILSPDFPDAFKNANFRGL
jgi:hypothetical protein